MTPHLKHPSLLLLSPSLSYTIHGGVKSLPTPGIRQGNFTALPHSLGNARKVGMLYHVFAPRLHLFEQNQVRNDSMHSDDSIPSTNKMGVQSAIQ